MKIFPRSDRTPNKFPFIFRASRCAWIAPSQSWIDVKAAARLTYLNYLFVPIQYYQDLWHAAAVQFLVQKRGYYRKFTFDPDSTLGQKYICDAFLTRDNELFETISGRKMDLALYNRYESYRMIHAILLTRQ